MEMSNDYYIPDYGDDRELQENHQEYEVYEFNELKTKGVNNEHHYDDFGAIRNGKVSQPSQYESRKYITDSSNQQASAVPF